MRYNEETGMEPRLMEEIQSCLAACKYDRFAMARLGGISTALHALTDKIWSCEKRDGRYVYVNEDGTECITAE